MQRRGAESQSVVMWTPSLIDVIEGVRNPLLFKNFVPFLTNVEGLASPRTKRRKKVIKSNKIQ